MNKVILSILLLVGVYFVHELYLGEHRIDLGPLRWERVSEKIDSIGVMSEEELTVVEATRVEKKESTDVFRNKIQASRLKVRDLENAVTAAENAVNTFSSSLSRTNDNMLTVKLKFQEDLRKKLEDNSMKKRLAIDEMKQKLHEMNLTYKKFFDPNASENKGKKATNVVNVKDEKEIIRVKKQIELMEADSKKFEEVKLANLKMLDNEEAGFIKRLNEFPEYKELAANQEKLTKDIKQKKIDIENFKKDLEKENERINKLNDAYVIYKQGGKVDLKELGLDDPAPEKSGEKALVESGAAQPKPTVTSGNGESMPPTESAPEMEGKSNEDSLNADDILGDESISGKKNP